MASFLLVFHVDVWITLLNSSFLSALKFTSFTSWTLHWMTMTSQQNGDINSEQQFVLQCNMSSCKQKLSNPSEKAWITVCKHIFCNFCGLDHLSQSLPLKCPICSHQLTSVFDILTAQLNPPTHFQSVITYSFKQLYTLKCLRQLIYFICFRWFWWEWIQRTVSWPPRVVSCFLEFIFLLQ